LYSAIIRNAEALGGKIYKVAKVSNLTTLSLHRPFGTHCRTENARLAKTVRVRGTANSARGLTAVIKSERVVRAVTGGTLVTDVNNGK